MLFDTHAHYYDEKFGDELEREARINEVIKSVPHIINCGTNPNTSNECLYLSKKHIEMYSAFGLHPEDISDDGNENDEMIEQISSMLDDDKCVALGEIGLDYHWRDDNRDEQIRCFEKQLKIAFDKNLPVIIHDREAHGDCLESVKKFKGIRGVFHSYSGSIETAQELLKLGWYISFSGVITFKNATRLADVVKAIPDDRILIETDCPYLAPHPKRGEINDSRLMSFTAEKAAELRNTDVNEFIKLTEGNAFRLFDRLKEKNNV